MIEARLKRPHIVEFHLYQMSTMDKSLETESRLVGARGWGVGEGMLLNRYGVSLGGNEKLLELDSGDVWTTF